MLENTSKEFELNPYVPVTKETPPMFLLQAEDDPIDTVQKLPGLLLCAEKGRSSCRDAFVCTRRPWVRHSAHEDANHRMASIGGEVARVYRDIVGIVGAQSQFVETSPTTDSWES
jgi:hypothetical protein